MKFDYNYFTKSELVEFLNKHGEDFGYITKPYLIIIKERQNKLYKELELIHESNQRLLEKMLDFREQGDIIGYYNTSKAMDKNHSKWEEIHKQLDKLSRKLVGD